MTVDNIITGCTEVLSNVSQGDTDIYQRCQTTSNDIGPRRYAIPGTPGMIQAFPSGCGLLDLSGVR